MGDGGDELLVCDGELLVGDGDGPELLLVLSGEYPPSFGIQHWISPPEQGHS